MAERRFYRILFRFLTCYVVCAFPLVTAETGMTKIGKILFNGRGWPAAQVRRSTRRVVDPAAVGTVVTCEFTATGRGRPWSTEEPQAFWRTFAELPFEGTDPTPMLEFVRRWGDPLGFPATDETDPRLARAISSTSYWLGLVGELRLLAAAWSRPDRHGVSRCNNDKAHEAALRAWRGVVFPRIAPNFTLESDTDGALPVVRASTLIAYMQMSAASALDRRVPMRRCEQCEAWFELLRPDARFCSPSCRALSHKQRNIQAR
jgi:hypothetical protein